ncbi:UNVERIFIED_CONTAM: hypothetical protein ABID98_001667 [Brevibacillus sp. OAP136]
MYQKHKKIRPPHMDIFKYRCYINNQKVRFYIRLSATKTCAWYGL